MRRSPVLEDFSLQVEAGFIYGLLGPNGAGKTTALKLLVGLIRPDRGSVRVAGRDTHTVQARRSVGFLPENPYFYDYLSGFELLDFQARLLGLSAAERRNEIDTVLARVGIQSVRDRALRKYSKGMLQRLALAQALLGKPQLLILDEPMSGLDPIGRREFRDIILSERKRGATILFSSHILQDAELICDRVAILVAGRLQSVGPLGDKLANKVKHYEVVVVGVNAEQYGDYASVVTDDDTGMLLRTADAESAQRIIRRTIECGGKVRSVLPHRETLEDIFLDEVAKGTASS